MEYNDLVSIIVPVYNVEKYITQCIQSICEQTYKNIEIIIINDGSTDNTGVLIEEISNKDSRIKIHTTPNRGVSSARNTGLDFSQGKYITFIDADDYLAPDYIEYFVTIAHTTGAEFCLSKNCFTKNGENQVEQDNIEELNAIDGIALLLSPRVIVGCWNKLYSRAFLINHNIRFLTDLFYGEGLSLIITCAENANKIAVGNRKVYYYRRNNEFSATTKFDIEKLRNGEKALYRIIDTVECKDSEKINEMFTLHMCLYSLGAMTRLINNGAKNKYRQDYKRWQLYIRTHTRKIIKSRNISTYRKLLIFMGNISPVLIAKLDKLRRKRITERSVANY